MALLVCALVVAAAWAAVGWRSALGWKDRSGQYEAQAKNLRDKLDASEADVADLEDRIAALANEKAAAQDEREFAGLEAEQAQQVAELVAEVNSELFSCIDIQTGVMNSLLDVLDGKPVDGTALSSQADELETTCSSALKKAGELDQLIGG